MVSRLPEWISAIATAIAAAGALAAAVIYYLLLKREYNKRDEDRERARRHTPERIAAWFDKDELIVQNSGEEPIYDLVIYIGTDVFQLSDPDQFGQYVELVVGTLGPNAIIRETGYKPKERETGPFPRFPEVAIEFTDTRGAHWRRHPREVLEERKSRRPFD